MNFRILLLSLVIIYINGRFVISFDKSFSSEILDKVFFYFKFEIIIIRRKNVKTVFVVVVVYFNLKLRL